jgi:phytanoyl-CoA hydroxylase
VVIHGNVLHKSEANRSLKSRYIYTFHVIEGEAEYDERNWFFILRLNVNFRLQPNETGFSKVY